MDAAQAALVAAGFWLALVCHRRETGRGGGRLAAALVAGALAAYAGPGACFAAPGAAPARVGASVLFVPLGPLALAREPAAFRALGPALALARLGCVAAGCCTGRGGEPLAALEALAWLGLSAWLRALPCALVAPAFLVAFGALRIAQAPWRPSPAAAAPVSPEAVSAGWVALGAAWAVAARARRTRRAPSSGGRGPGGAGAASRWPRVR